MHWFNRSLKNLTTSLVWTGRGGRRGVGPVALIWLVTRGGWGGGVGGGGPGRRAMGDQRAASNKEHWFHLAPLKISDLAGGWGGGVGGVGQGGGQRGGDGRGGTREHSTFKNLITGLIG